MHASCADTAQLATRHGGVPDATRMDGQERKSDNDASDEEPWWKRAVIYEVVPISFQDSNGDGKGDLPGLLSRLDYLQWLGIDAVWLTPVYRSPFRDLGYDISDYCAVDPSFGNLADIDALVATFHQAGIRIILDLVPNHTSNDHLWFTVSSSSRDNAKADWYVWMEGSETGGPPNNWLSRFGGSGWEWCEPRQQYYYHSFLAQQPDLNWRNHGVRTAIADVMRFWLNRGIDGFRVDASAVLIKDDLLRDNPPDPEADENTPAPQRFQPVFTDDRPETMQCIEFMRQVLDEYPDRLLCGEVQGKIDRIGHFYGTERPRLHLPLNFALLDTAWDALSLQATIDAYFNALPESGWPCWVVGGHDKQRVASRIGQDQARILAMLLMTLKGTPIFYMGDEIGRERVRIPPERVQDPFEKLVKGHDLCRDPERAPMRWNGSPKGGFTTGEPWLPLEANGDRNVERQQGNDLSILRLYRRLIALRRELPCLQRGEYHPVRSQFDVLSFERVLGARRLLVGLNIAREPRKWFWHGSGRLLLSSYLGASGYTVEGPTLLRANEGVLVDVSACVGSQEARDTTGRRRV